MSINKTSHESLMNLLCDGPNTAIVETGWSIYPLWYSGEEIASIISYDMIKDAIEQSNAILANEIQLAKRFNDTRRIGEFSNDSCLLLSMG